MSSSIAFQMGARNIAVPVSYLEKYGTTGPRYTSYPTAPEWKDDFDSGAFSAILDNCMAGGDLSPLSLYYHIPFCNELCFFCGCNMIVPTGRARVSPYLDTVKRQVEMVARKINPKRVVSQYHWGGGTPTFLTPDEIADLFAHSKKHFSFAPDAEISIEVDPRVTTAEQIQLLRQIGFNRISMGVQDFEPAVMEAVNRRQTYETVRSVTALCRDAGFQSVNFDLIYGLPHQTAESFSATVDKVIGLSPDRIALFNYAHVPWLKRHQKVIREEWLPSGSAKFALFAAGIDRFSRAGYEFIGLDHFAKPNDELSVAHRSRTLHRNFEGYTTRAGCELLGFGVSAISCLHDAFVQSQGEIAAYQAAVVKGLPVARGKRLSADDKVRARVITELFCNSRVVKKEIGGEFGLDFDDYFSGELKQLGPLAADELVISASDRLEVTDLGRIFIRNIGMVFDAYLKGASAARKFSRTV